ncbi:MAG: OmpA family protein [Pseudomonadota bacterium]|nr:OmpA family protein [Pseudomonadota bacterium]
MNTQDDDNQGVVWAILIGVVLLAISLAVGMGLYRTGQTAGAPAASSAGSVDALSRTGTEGTVLGAGVVAASGNAAQALGDGPAIRVEAGVVKFYFASGSAELAAGAAEALGDVVRGVAAGQVAVISGFHDTTGNAAQNEELAKQRALAVREALMALGIGEDKLSLEKPAVTTAAGSNAEARRVEVTLR